MACDQPVAPLEAADARPTNAADHKAHGEQPTREEAIRLLKSGLGKVLQETAAQYAIPICWIAARAGKPVVLANGSGFIIDCGVGPFLVTARHVLQGYRDARPQHPDAVCMVGELRFDPLERLIAEDTAYDVATFRVTADDIARLKSSGKIPLTGSQRSWPPQPPLVGRGAFFVGFPGDGRSLRPYRGGSLVEIDWSGWTALAVADSVSPTGISLLLQHDPTYDVGLRPVAPPDWALGGCSGAPLLTFVEETPTCPKRGRTPQFRRNAGFHVALVVQNRSTERGCDDVPSEASEDRGVLLPPSCSRRPANQRWQDGNQEVAWHERRARGQAPRASLRRAGGGRASQRTEDAWHPSPVGIERR